MGSIGQLLTLHQCYNCYQPHLTLYLRTRAMLHMTDEVSTDHRETEDVTLAAITHEFAFCLC